MARVNTYADEPEEARLAREQWERQQKNAPRTGSATTDLLLRAFDNDTRRLEGGVQLQDYKAGKIDSTQINEEQRPIGSKAILDGELKYWSGQNYGYQSKESFDQLTEEGQFRMGQISGQRIGNDIVNAISPEAKQAAANTVQSVVKAGQDLYYESPSVRQAVDDLQPILQLTGGAIRLADAGLEQFSRITNTSRLITDEVVMGLATGGVSMAARRATPLVKQGIKYIDEVAPVIDDFIPPSTPQFAMAGAGGPQVSIRGGSATLQPPTVNKLTVTERIAEGVKQGIANTPEFADQLKRMDIRWAQSEKRLKRWVEAVDDPRQSKNIKKSRDALKGKASTGPARVEDIADENWYTKDNKDFVDIINQTPRLGLERHHMFPKAESYIFVEHMRSLIRQGIADRDDMVNLFLYAEDAGAVMGNRKANMLLMDKMTQHGPHHRMREKTAGALGLVMEPDNLQEIADVVKTATNADELMAIFDQYLIKNIKPSKRDAFERVMGPSKQILTETLNQRRLQSTLTEAQRRRL